MRGVGGQDVDEDEDEEEKEDKREGKQVYTQDVKPKKSSKFVTQVNFIILIYPEKQT